MFSKTKSPEAKSPKTQSPETKQNTAYNNTETSPLKPTKSLPSASRQSASVIGSNTQVHGDINSDEDLTIEGQVIGIVTCKQHTVTLGSDGNLHGDAYAHTLRVSGKVEGNLVALHKAIVHEGADVSGTITTPCLVLEDGSIFQGNIDMNPNNDIFTNIFTSQQQKNTTTKTSGDQTHTDVANEKEDTARVTDAESNPTNASGAN
ncbi:bactofilin family protein [Halomonas llamarensis]|uniref:Polymer-forming cytoskeletal protein n=1 Tax=Halomonas llamarensis TaxID=2945104 RepID=A0ABT0SPT4_9GAMM|nr:polymer-forming cytoskeletal protein [Halomonas llamarensis]MCL7929814.1 polymer-forming cytoskeletal protein [Halomonas llamarensis]